MKRGTKVQSFVPSRFRRYKGWMIPMRSLAEEDEDPNWDDINDNVEDGIECPDCKHLSLFYTQRYKATRDEPASAAGYCACGDLKPRVDSIYRVDPEDAKFDGCPCRYEFG